jgi:hypothetical protein
VLEPELGVYFKSRPFALQWRDRESAPIIRRRGKQLAGPILTVVDDLFFLSKIQQTARQAGVLIEPVEPSGVKERAIATSAQSVILDLNHRSGAAISVAQGIKSDPTTSHILVVGFLSHVQADLAVAARDAGCDFVLARSAFSQQLPQLLLKLVG